MQNKNKSLYLLLKQPYQQQNIFNTINSQNHHHTSSFFQTNQQGRNKTIFKNNKTHCQNAFNDIFFNNTTTNHLSLKKTQFRELQLDKTQQNIDQTVTKNQSASNSENKFSFLEFLARKPSTTSKSALLQKYERLKSLNSSRKDQKHIKKFVYRNSKSNSLDFFEKSKPNTSQFNDFQDSFRSSRIVPKKSSKQVSAFQEKINNELNKYRKKLELKEQVNQENRKKNIMPSEWTQNLRNPKNIISNFQNIFEKIDRKGIKLKGNSKLDKEGSWIKQNPKNNFSPLSEKNNTKSFLNAEMISKILSIGKNKQEQLIQKQRKFKLKSLNRSLWV